MSKVTKTFQTGACHMAVVCESDKSALLLRNMADKVFSQLQNCAIQKRDSGMYDDNVAYPIHEKDRAELAVVGVLTLENVIERILQVDIYDERDRENAMAVL